MYLNLRTRYPETNINGELVSVNGQDRSISHPDEREAYLVLGSQVSGIQKVYADFRSELDNKKLDEPADLSIKHDRDLLLEGQTAPDMPSVKDYMTFVRKELRENAYFTPYFDNISKSFESYEYDKFKAKMNFEKWVKKKKASSYRPCAYELVSS